MGVFANGVYTSPFKPIIDGIMMISQWMKQGTPRMILGDDWKFIGHIYIPIISYIPENMYSHHIPIIFPSYSHHWKWDVY